MTPEPSSVNHRSPTKSRSSELAAATAATLALRDGSGAPSFGYVAGNNLWVFQDSHLQSIAYQTVGGRFENRSRPALLPPILQQNVAGLVDGGTYTFYIWARAASGTKKVSIAIVNNAYGAYLAGPTQVTLTTTWQRFRITGTLAGGQTGLWIVVRQFEGNGDTWTTGNILLWGACLQEGTDPKKAYARTFGFQAHPVAAGCTVGSLLVVGKDSVESPFRVTGPGSSLTDHTLLEMLANGELLVGAGAGYRLADIVGASNASG